MPVDEGVLRNLQEMGIDEPLARAAAERFSNVDAAVNWCFGDGANVSLASAARESFALIGHIVEAGSRRAARLPANE